MKREEIEQPTGKTEKLHMKLGQNIGKILLEIAQTAIREGNPEKAIKTYTDSLNGFTEDYVIKILKNEYVLITSKDEVSVKLIDWENDRVANRDNIIDWNSWMKSRLDAIMSTVKALNEVRDEFEKHVHGFILDYNIINPVIDFFGAELARKVGIHNIAAKLIADMGFPKLLSNGENVWNELCCNVESDDGEKYQYALYFIVKYVDCIRILHNEYMSFISSCTFLMKNKLVERPLFLEDKIEAILDKLTEFVDTTRWYYHPLCNTKLYEYKESLGNDILSTEYGKEYRRYGIIEKNIMDGYDAGWLSPDGKFYGENGTFSNMIHLRIAEKISGGNLDGDRKLEEKGWIKIHGNEVYGTFIGNITPKKDFPYSYCPTDIQIKMVCDYIDKFHNGKLYTQPQIIQVTEPFTTYNVRQMDEIKLHEIFAL